MKDSFFDKIESKTGVPMEEVFALANAIQLADFKDESQVRRIIQNVGRLANKNVTPQMEEELVNSIVNGGKPLDFSDIERLL